MRMNPKFVVLGLAFALLTPALCVAGMGEYLGVITAYDRTTNTVEIDGYSYRLGGGVKVFGENLKRMPAQDLHSGQSVLFLLQKPASAATTDPAGSVSEIWIKTVHGEPHIH